MRVTGRAIGYLVVGVLVTTVAGCGGDEAGGGGDEAGGGAAASPESQASEPAPAASVAPVADGGAPDPCALLTEDEVATAVGDVVAAVEGPEAGYLGTYCRWTYPHPRWAGEEAEAAVYVWEGDEFYSPDTDEASITGFEEMSGIGDRAHRWPSAAEVCTVIFQRGDYVVQLTTSGTGGDVCVGLAERADARM